MKYKNQILLLFLIYSFPLLGQNQFLRASADSFMMAFRNNDFEYCSSKTYNPMVEMAGGHEAFTRISKNTALAWQNAGFVTTQLSFNNASPHVEAGKEWHAIVQYDIEYNLNDNIFIGTIFLLAISSDLGEHWSFLNLESYDEASISEFVLTYNHRLTFPKITSPVVKE